MLRFDLIQRVAPSACRLNAVFIFLGLGKVPVNRYLRRPDLPLFRHVLRAQDFGNWVAAIMQLRK